MYIQIDSLEDTKNLASQIALRLQGFEKITLNGELGSGKTTFTRFLLNDFGFTDVTSPSYCLQNIYQGKNLTIEHWDLYRINQLPEELEDASDSVRIIEWGSKFDLKPDLELNFETVDESTRKVEIKVYQYFDELQFSNLKII